MLTVHIPGGVQDASTGPDESAIAFASDARDTDDVWVLVCAPDNRRSS